MSEHDFMREQNELFLAKKFLAVYNERKCTHYDVRNQPAPSFPVVECMDVKTTELLYLEIRQLGNWVWEIQHLHGRGEKHGLSDNSGLSFYSFNDDEFPELTNKLEKKLLSSYRINIALVIKQVSPNWSCEEWIHAGEEFHNFIENYKNNFGAGIWILTQTKDNKDDIFQISRGKSELPNIQPELTSLEANNVAKPTWERIKSKSFLDFSARENVDPVIRIDSPHNCNEAILIAFVKDEPEDERKRAIQFCRENMVYYCICGRGKFNSSCY